MGDRSGFLLPRRRSAAAGDVILLKSLSQTKNFLAAKNFLMLWEEKFAIIPGVDTTARTAKGLSDGRFESPTQWHGRRRAAPFVLNLPDDSEADSDMQFTEFLCGSVQVDRGHPQNSVVGARIANKYDHRHRYLLANGTTRTRCGLYNATATTRRTLDLVRIVLRYSLGCF